MKEVIETILSNISPEFQSRVRSALDVIRFCMEEAEKLSLPGSDKAAVVKCLLESEKLVSLLPPSIADSIHIMIEQNLVQPTIDIIVQASRGRLDLNKSIDCCIKFLKKRRS